MRWGWRSARAPTAALVRQGAAQAGVTASFDRRPPAAVAALLAENGLELEPGEPLIVRRIVKADGGSRAFVNDQPASAGAAARARRRIWSRSTASTTIAGCSIRAGTARCSTLSRGSTRGRSPIAHRALARGRGRAGRRARRAWTPPRATANGWNMPSPN